jgi:thioredoxin reductase
MYDMIIIGGGPAGLSAAIFALGKQLDFLMICDELSGKSGWRQQLVGQVAEEYLAGDEAVRLFARRIKDCGGRVLRDRVAEVTRTADSFQVETTNHVMLQSRTVIVATGVTPLALDVPGARELLGQGLGYSIVTHNRLLTGKTAAVVGTTVRALRGVTELAPIAKQIYVIAPDTASLATPLARALRYRPNVEVLAGYTVKEIAGPFNVEELVVEHEGQIRRLSVDAAFVDLGLVPNSAMVRRIVQTDYDGFIWVDDRNGTSQNGVFAAGDVTTAFGEQVLIAIGEGARAALSAYDYVLAHPHAAEAVADG